MIGALTEAVRDLALPCSLAMVVPGVAATMATKANALAVAIAGFSGATLVGWLRVTGQVPARMSTWVAVAVGVLVLVAFGALAAGGTRTGQRSTAGFVIGSAAAAIWTPCVGEELGAILNAGPTDPLGVALPFTAFTAGLSVVAISVALGRVGFDLPARLTRVLSVAGTIIGIGVSLLIATGAYTDVVARLVLWSL